VFFFCGSVSVSVAVLDIFACWSALKALMKELWFYLELVAGFNLIF